MNAHDEHYNQSINQSLTHSVGPSQCFGTLRTWFHPPAVEYAGAAVGGVAVGPLFGELDLPGPGVVCDIVTAHDPVSPAPNAALLPNKTK